MRNYLIMVEGAHDIAVMERLLQLNGIQQRVRSETELPSVWIHTIPGVYPFTEGRLERITPVPSFMKNEEISVAIKNANSDTEIMPALSQLMDIMQVREKDQLDGIMLICDADRKKADEKRKQLLNDYREKPDFKIIWEKGAVSGKTASGGCGITEDLENPTLDIGIKQVPLYTFLFPDNETEGNLENLLLETAQAVYPELLKLAEDYIVQAAEYQKKLKREAYAKKAVVGCIANVMKPGKANQVSIADDGWISEETLEVCRMLGRLNRELKKMIK